MQNISADPVGVWLAGTDWSGLNYLWRIKQIGKSYSEYFW